MPDYDLRLDVAGHAYLNAQLVFLLEKGGTLWDAKKHLFSQKPYVDTFSDEHVYSYTPGDHSLAVSLLFCTIVVPREILDLPKTHQIWNDFDDQNAMNCFTAIEPSMDSYDFIRRLRNSVAHALFSITEEDGEARYKFWTDREPRLRQAIIMHSELLRFISLVGQRLTNALLSRKNDMG
jgi:hypothetical protein